MAKLTLSNVVSGFASTTTTNANNDLIEAALENTLSRDGTSPNTMNANLDMNGYRVLNELANTGEGFIYAGTWTTGTAYTLNDLVYIPASTASSPSRAGWAMICRVAHTAGTFSVDQATNWADFAARGASGNGSGDLIAANNLSDVASAATSRVNLGVEPASQAVTATTRAATTTLGTSLNHTLSDTSTTITAFNGVAGVTYHCRALGAGSITHNATNLIITQGTASLTTAAGMTFDVEMITSTTCRIKNVMKATAPAGITLATQIASTSGTSIDFTGIPAGVKRVKIMLDGVSTNGAAEIMFQIGDSGGIENTGYISSGGSGGSVVINATAGFTLNGVGTEAGVLSGSITFDMQNSATFSWVALGIFARSDAAAAPYVAGRKLLSAELDRVRITTVNGTDAFDAGLINISYET